MQKHGHQSDPKARANVVITEVVCPVYFCSCVCIGVALFDICSCEDHGNSADGTGVHDGFLWSERLYSVFYTSLGSLQTQVVLSVAQIG